MVTCQVVDMHVPKDAYIHYTKSLLRGTDKSMALPT